MEDPRTEEPSIRSEQPSYSGPSNGQENDAETIANRVVDVFWKSLQAHQEGGHLGTSCLFCLYGILQLHFSSSHIQGTNPTKTGLQRTAGPPIPLLILTMWQ